MDNELHIEGTTDRPTVHFERSNGLCRISGRSLPEDAFTFYKPIISWLSEYASNPATCTILVVNLEYFNTASAKQIFKVISIVNEIGKQKEVKVQWHYDKGDRDMLSSGERFSQLASLPFEYIEN